MAKMIYWVNEARMDGDEFESGFTFEERDAVETAPITLNRLTKQERQRTTVAVCGLMVDVHQNETAKEAYDRLIEEDGCLDCDFYNEVV